MKLVMQRVSRASVTVRGNVIGRISQGYLVLVGIGQGDTREDADRLVRKMIGLRIFSDENGRINKSLKDVDGQLLMISQFTLYADCRHGNRPGFTDAGDPEAARELYEYMIASCRREIPVVEQGEFGAKMQVELVNDGPFTIILDSEMYREKKK